MGKNTPAFHFPTFQMTELLHKQTKTGSPLQGLTKKQGDDTGHNYFVLWKMFCVFLQEWPKALRRYKA